MKTGSLINPFSHLANKLRIGLSWAILFICIFPPTPTSAQTATLDNYLEQGMQRSPLLKDYNNQLLAFDVDSAKIRAALKPLISVNSAIIYPPVINGYGYDQGVTNGGTYAALAGINQPLLTKRFKETQFAFIGLQKQSVANLYKISEHDLRKNIADQYITAYQDAQQIRFSEQVDSLLHQEMDLLKAQSDAGIYKLSDLLAFSIEMHTNEIETEQQKQQYRDDVFALNFISGISDTALVQLEVPSIQYHLAGSVFNSPVFLKFTIDSLTIANGRRIVDLNYRTKLNAFADAGLNAALPQNIPKNFGFSVGMSLSVPIYDGHLRQLEYKKLGYAEQTRKNYHDFLSDQVKIRTQQLEAEKKANDILLQRLKDEEVDMESLLEMNKRQLNTGSISITDYIVNLRKYIDMQNKIKTAQVKSYTLINEYNYLVW